MRRPAVSVLQNFGAWSAFAVVLACPCPVVAAGKVSVVAVAEEGEPLSAKRDAFGVTHLLLNSQDGPKYAMSADNGRTFSRLLPVLDHASRKPNLEFTAWDLAVTSSGQVHVVMGTNAWKLKLPEEEWGCFYASLEPDADAFSPVRNINRKPSEGFSVAADDQGRVTLCWMADRLYANISHDGGTTFEDTVEMDSSLDPCNCCTTSCIYGADGRLAVLYREETNNDRDIHLALWDQEHNHVSRTRVSQTSWKIDACPMTYYTIVANDTGYLAVWPTRDSIYFARLDVSGNLNSAGEIKTPGKTGMRTGMIALNGSDDCTLVAWKKDGQLGWQQYDSHGRLVGRPGSTKSAGSGAAGVVTSSGDFLLFP